MADPRMRTLEPIDAYALWAPTYAARAHTPLMEIEERAVRRLLPDVRGQIVLDAACGTGRYQRILEARGAALACGVDLSPVMLRRNARPSITVCGDLRQLPFRSGSFDAVVCGLAVGHVEQIDACMREMSRLLRHGGVLVYSDMHPAGARAGWLRTFRADDGSEYAVRHHIHSGEANLSACRGAGLDVEQMLEPPIDVPHRYRGWPAALVIRARKR